MIVCFLSFRFLVQLAFFQFNFLELRSYPYIKGTLRNYVMTIGRYSEY